jgi:hypothetical protein
VRDGNRLLSHAQIRLLSLELAAAQEVEDMGHGPVVSVHDVGRVLALSKDD